MPARRVKGDCVWLHKHTHMHARTHGRTHTHTNTHTHTHERGAWGLTVRVHGRGDLGAGNEQLRGQVGDRACGGAGPGGCEETSATGQGAKGVG